MPSTRTVLASAVLALALALVVPPGATADTSRYRDAAARGEVSVSFKVISQGGRPQKIKKFRFQGAVVTCESGPAPSFTTRSEKPHFGPFGVTREGRFGRKFTSATPRFDGTVAIRGEFETRRRVSGTLRIEGGYPQDGYADCDSGRLEWTAKLT
jgi:hypothetical protein